MTRRGRRARRERREELGPPRRRRFAIRNWGPLADGCFIVLAILLLLVIGTALAIGWDYIDRTRHDRVTAQVISVETSCLLEHRSGGRNSTVTRSEEFPCAEEAERRAAGLRGELIRFLTVTYLYTSPRDGMEYSGRLHREEIDFPPGVRAGGTMPVYARKSDPGRSRGIYGWPVD